MSKTIKLLRELEKLEPEELLQELTGRKVSEKHVTAIKDIATKTGLEKELLNVVLHAAILSNKNYEFDSSKLELTARTIKMAGVRNPSEAMLVLREYANKRPLYLDWLNL